MPGWISRTLTRLAAQPAKPAPGPRSGGELQQVVASCKHLINAGNYVQARAILKEAILANPHHADLLAHDGVAAYFAGDPAEAKTRLMQAVQIDPDHLLGQKYLAVACSAVGDLERFETAATAAMRLAPRDYDVLNMYGIARMNRADIDGAARCFGTAVEIAPENVNALINIDLLSMRTLRDRRLLETSPKIPAARTQMISRLRAALAQRQLSSWDLKNLLILLGGSRDTFQLALEVAHEAATRDDFTKELADHVANLVSTAGDLPNLLKFRQLAADLEPRLPMVQAYLAQAKLVNGYDDWRDCWSKMREGERYANLAAYASEVPAWTGEQIGSKKILVYQEQGLGDAILALRLIPMLARRGVRFDLWVNPALAGLASSVKGYENLIRSNTRPDARRLGCEYASTLFGLISALDADHAELIRHPTVLVPSPERMPAARARLRALPGQRIGLAYGGNPDRRDDWFRAVPPSALKPLAALEGISWISLVVDKRPDKAEVVEMFGMDDPTAEVNDFDDTAAIISELDAVIAIDASVAHLACSLGKPVWVLVPPMLDWRWQIGDDTKPWWPTATVLRSASMGQWDSVIEELARRLPS
jgi:tetratricopeptide (TPR) repeat protein